MSRTTSSARTNWLASALAPAGVFVTLLVWAAPASGALDIIPNFNQGASESPAFDPDGAGLISLFAEAESIYEDIIYDFSTITINYWYEDLSGDPLGIHHVVSQGGSPWREFEANIRIDTMDGVNERDWFIDGSPNDNDEFNMRQWLYRDLSPAEQGIQFNGDTPDVFEAGYLGAATDPAAMDRFDMLTVVLHEIGHALGMSAENDATTGETTDGDYDVNPDFVGDAAMAVNYASPTDIDHLAGDKMLLYPGLPTDTRILPSAADFFSMAAGHDYGIVLPPRQDYLGGLEFTDPGNWIGVGINHLAHAYVRRNGGVAPYAFTQTDFNMRNLSVLEGSWVTTDDTINIYEKTTIDGTGAGEGNTSRIRVQSNGSLETEDLFIGHAGVLELIGGDAEVDAEATVRYGGRIEGHGYMYVSDRLTNNGLIAAEGGYLVLSTLSLRTDEIWDLDGDGGGRVEAIDGGIFIYASHFGTFEGQMVIGAGRDIIMTDPWELGTAGQLLLDGAVGSPARLLAEGIWAETTVAGRVDVHGEAVLDGAVIFVGSELGGSAWVLIPVSSDRLRLPGRATFLGGIFNGGGTLEQAGDILVKADTAVGVHTFDWGNSEILKNNRMAIQGATFTVDSATTGTPENEYRGNIYLESGTLQVNTDEPWTLPAMSPDSDLPEGMLILGEAKKGSAPTVQGQQLTVGGSLRTYSGLGVIDAPFVTRPTATISVFSEAELELRRRTSWNGGTISGDGGIRQIGDARVVGPTQIDTSYYDFDGDDDSPSQTTIDPSRTLKINSTSIENGGADSFDGVVNVNGGTLIINTPGPWTLGQSGAVNLRYVGGPAAVAGSPMVVSGDVTTTGGNEILSPVRFRQSANVVATAPGDVLRLRDHTNYEGGSYTGSGGIIQDATAFVDAPTTIDLGFFDMDGSPDANGEEDNFVELHTDLTLNVDRVDTSDNRFNGELEITDPATLTVNTPTPWTMAGAMEIVGPAGTEVTVAGAEIVLEADVYIEQQNLLRFEADVSGPGNFVGGGDYVILGDDSPGSSPAVVTSAGNVSFADSARLLLDIAGTDVVPVPQYDRLVIAGDVALDGRVVFRFTDGFAPQENDAFDVIVAAGDVTNMLGDGDILIENLAPGFLYDAGFDTVAGLSVFRLTALNDAVVASSISGRHVFYNNSAFDLPADGRTDDDAVAPDKRALLPGETATPENYTSYAKGINGIMIDIDGLPAGSVPTADDFQFRVGNHDNPDTWSDAPDPIDIFLRPGEGDDGSDRITIIWDDNAIQKEWLQIVMLATEGTGLMEDDVFYFGNAIGETGDSLTDAKVNIYDMLAARDHPRTFLDPAPIDFDYDFDRNQRVNAYDMLIARDNQTSFLDALKLITVPGPKGAELAAVPEPGTVVMLAGVALGLMLALRRR